MNSIPSHSCSANDILQPPSQRVVHCHRNYKWYHHLHHTTFTKHKCHHLPSYKQYICRRASIIVAKVLYARTSHPSQLTNQATACFKSLQPNRIHPPTTTRRKQGKQRRWAVFNQSLQQALASSSNASVFAFPYCTSQLCHKSHIPGGMPIASRTIDMPG